MTWITCWIVGFSYIIGDLKLLVQLLIYHFQTSIDLCTRTLDEDSLDHLASLLHCINLVVKSFTQSKYQSSVNGDKIAAIDEDVFLYVKVFFELFPIQSPKHSPMKVCFYLNGNVFHSYVMFIWLYFNCVFVGGKW